jgi:hypothetical protein
MASVTKVNGGGFDHGVQYSVANLQGFELDAGADLTSKDGIGGFIDTVVQEFQPLLYKSTGTAGKIFMICDGHAVDAASMTARYQAMSTASITVDGIDTRALTIVARDLDAFDAN